MGFAVELKFDAPTTDRIHTLCQRLSTAGITSPPITYGAEAHISLAVFENVQVERMIGLVEAFASTCQPLAVQINAVGTFPSDEGVVYLAPVVVPELLALHARFHTALDKIGEESHRYYWPNAWTPHCTVADSLREGQFGRVIDLCRSADVFGPGYLDSIAFVEFRPTQYHLRLPLSE